MKDPLEIGGVETTRIKGKDKALRLRKSEKGMRERVDCE